SSQSDRREENSLGATGGSTRDTRAGESTGIRCAAARGTQFPDSLTILSEWHPATSLDSPLIRSTKVDQPVFVQLYVLYRIPPIRIADVNLSIGRLHHARVGVLAGVRLECQRRFPCLALVKRSGHAQWRATGLRIVEHQHQMAVGQLCHRDSRVGIL